MEQASSTIQATSAEIRHTLLSPLALPEWNEAFLSIEGPAEPSTGERYSLRVRPGWSGWLGYTAIEADRIELTWQVPGFHETGSWTIVPGGQSTLVRHSFEHAGPLAAVLRHAYRGVAAIRLQRLARVAEHSRGEQP
jgi:hypothetical protein